MERTIPGKKTKTWVYLAWLSSFLEIWKLLFHSLQEQAAEKLKPDVLREWK